MDPTLRTKVSSTSMNTIFFCIFSTHPSVDGDCTLDQGWAARQNFLLLPAVGRTSARWDAFYPRFALGDAALIKPLGTLPKRLRNMVEKALGLS